MKKTLKIWVMPNGAFNATEITSVEINAFKKQYPSIDVQFDIIPWTHAWDRIITCIKNKAGPDIIQIGNSWTSQLAIFNAFKDLTKRTKKAFTHNFPSAIWDSCKKPGTSKIISIPWFLDVRVLYYRKDILSKYKVGPDDIETWQEFQDICKLVHNTRYNNMRIGGISVSQYIDNLLVHDIAAWIWNFGGDFFSPTGDKIILDSKETFEGIRYYFNLINNYSFSESHFSYSSPADNFFLHDKYAFIYMSSWPIPKYFSKQSAYYDAKYPENIGITIIPSGPANNISFCGGSNLAIMNYCTLTDEAFEFIKFLTTMESQIRFCKNIYSLPCNIDAFDPVLSSTKRYGEILKKSYLNSRGLPIHPLWGTIEIMLGETFAEIISLIYAQKYTEALLKRKIERLNTEIQYLLDL